VNLPTIVVCDAAEKREAIEALIGTQPSLIMLGTVGRNTATQQTFQQGIKVIWIELAPDPEKGLALLSTLRERYPKVHYLVSHDTLQADLVKTAMQLGAVEYLDSQGAANLLPGAIARISSKEESASSQAEAPPLAPLSASHPSQTYERLPAASQGSIAQGHRVDESGGGPSTKAVSNNMRRARSLSPEGDPNSPIPPWLLPAIMLVMVVVAIIVVWTMKH
jgi:DNA-binding NarL/FixJ family response regulator